MDSERKRDIAKRLLELTHETEQLEYGSASGVMTPLLVQLREKQHALMLELYVEYYSEEQLRAELAFYTSEVGESIVKVRSEIARRLREKLPELVKGIRHSESSGSGDGGLEIRRSKLNSEQARELLKILKSRGIIETKKSPPDEDDE